MSTRSGKGYYYQQAGELNRRLKQVVPADVLKTLHKREPHKHFLIAGRQLLLLLACPLLMWLYPHWWVQLPAGILMGFVIFSFTILLHEAVHNCIFTKDPNGWTERLGVFYGAITGVSGAQFTQWHMDHHFELGTEDKDPKRANLTPKRNARWYKLLYMTPALLPIYFRGAAQAVAGYPKDLQAKIKRQRLVAIGSHLVWVSFCWFAVSPSFAWWAFFFPVMFVFPVAFTVNRIGQHYVIDPDDIAAWSTLMRPNGVWNFLYLYSSYHLEHHYFPAVPFYNLPKLQKALDPFYEERGIHAYSYRALLYLWFVKNHRAHTKPEAAAPQLKPAHGKAGL